jgi:hypothetical protein
LERAVGIEPTTACLEGRRSTTELRPLAPEYDGIRVQTRR